MNPRPPRSIATGGSRLPVYILALLVTIALVYTAFVVLYAVIPQDWLGGEASTRGVLFGLRHDLAPPTDAGKLEPILVTLCHS